MSIGILNGALANYQCQVELAPIVLVLQLPLTQLDQQQLLSRSNCSPEISALLFEQLPTLRGKISPEFWEPLFKTQSHLHNVPQITMKPAFPLIIGIESLIQKKLPKNKMAEREDKEIMQIQSNNRLAFIDNLENLTLTRLQEEEKNQGLANNQELYELTQTTNHTRLATVLLKSKEPLGQWVWIKNNQCLQGQKQKLRGHAQTSNESLEKCFTKEFKLEKNPNDDFYVSNINDLQFYELKYPLAAGEILKMSHLKARRLVKSGEMIKGLLNSTNLSMELNLRSLGAGSYGEQITVENPKNKKRMMATIKGDNLVEISL